MEDILNLLDGLPRDQKRALLDSAAGTIGFKLVARGINTTSMPLSASLPTPPPRGGLSGNGNASAPRMLQQQSPYGKDSRIVELNAKAKELVDKLKSPLGLEEMATVRAELERTRTQLRLRKSEVNPSFRGKPTKGSGTTA